MATSSSNTDEESTLSMVDVLEESEELEEEAKAVLGDSDDKFCTYALGYRSRQALYACATCTLSEGASAGICLACSYACHDGHELLELYTKRNFRCDCGNSKFPKLTCKLTSDKAAVNDDNKYNSNFNGLYCSCKRPYPDPEDDVEDEMIQCVACEDWYHGRHLGIKKLPSHLEYQEMICPGCMERCDFLWPYTVHSMETTKLEDDVDSKDDIDIGSNQKVDDETDDKSKDVPVKQEPDSNQTAEDTNNSTGPGLETKPEQQNRVSSDFKDGDTSVPATSQTENGDTSIPTACELEQLRKGGVKRHDGATFWGKGWRSKLCSCQSCKELYERLQVSFLADMEDTVLAYEERGRLNQSGMSQYEKGMEALSNMERTQQVEVLQGYHDMKSGLKDFLESFAQSGKVVQTEDINKFFGEMQAKRQKTGPMQYFCR